MYGNCCSLGAHTYTWSLGCQVKTERGKGKGKHEVVTKIRPSHGRGNRRLGNRGAPVRHKKKQTPARWTDTCAGLASRLKVQNTTQGVSFVILQYSESYTHYVGASKEWGDTVQTFHTTESRGTWEILEIFTGMILVLWCYSVVLQQCGVTRVQKSLILASIVPTRTGPLLVPN